MRVHGSLAATGKGELTIRVSASSDDWLHHFEVRLGDSDYLSLGGTLSVDEAPEIIRQLRAAADEIEAWDTGRSSAPQPALTPDLAGVLGSVECRDGASASTQAPIVPGAPADGRHPSVGRPQTLATT